MDPQDHKTATAVIKPKPPTLTRHAVSSPASFNVSILTRGRNYIYLKMGIRRAAQTGWNGTKLLLGVLKETSDVFPPLKASVGGLVALIDIYERTKSNVFGMNDLSRHIDRLMGLLARRLEGDRETVSLFVDKPYVRVLTAQLEKLDEMVTQGTFRRFANSTHYETEIKTVCVEIERALQELQLNIGLTLERRTQVILQEVVLQSLKRAEAAAYTAAVPGAVSRRSCTPGTRDPIIDEILNWARDEDVNAAPVYWMSGLAGQGKTTITHTICERLDADDEKLSVISFFCSRQLDTAKEKLLVSTLAFKLAEASVSYAHELLNALRTDHDLGDQKLEVQMSKLLVGPWARSADCRDGLNPIIIVVDALDENEAGTQFVELILAASRAGSLRGLRILITSRPEPHIVPLCERIDERAVCRLNDVPHYLVHDDILRYLNAELSDHQNEHYLIEVANASAGLFIYASTVVRMVKTRRVRRTKSEEASTLRQLADRARGNSQISLLDDLYEVILEDAFPHELGPDDRDARERVLLTIIHAPSIPDVLPILALCTEVEVELVHAVVESLHPVLYIEDGAVFWHHASFQDYVLRIYDSRSRRERLLRRCFLIWDKPLDLVGEMSSGRPLGEMKPALRIRQAEYQALEKDAPDWPVGQHVYGAFRLTASMLGYDNLRRHSGADNAMSDEEDRIWEDANESGRRSAELNLRRGTVAQYGARRFSIS